ncbi:MAG: SAM-dependent methyltransferase, partial [Actinomycetota bacterium]|nr:SAM-dependent methyltransferase [Actinomycetota bacterium]
MVASRAEGRHSADEAIRERIANIGPLRFDEFMSMALYGPGGYYTTRVPGEFDYDTAPSGSEWFGKL